MSSRRVIELSSASTDEIAEVLNAGLAELKRRNGLGYVVATLQCAVWAFTQTLVDEAGADGGRAAVVHDDASEAGG